MINSYDVINLCSGVAIGAVAGHYLTKAAYETKKFEESIREVARNRMPNEHTIGRQCFAGLMKKIRTGAQ